MSAVKTDQSEGIPGAGIPEQAVKRMLTGSPALSLPSPFAFFWRSFSQFTLSPLSRSLEQATKPLPHHLLKSDRKLVTQHYCDANKKRWPFKKITCYILISKRLCYF